MRFLRLLTILGPAAVLYVLAARAPSSSDLGWALGLAAMASSLSPLVLLRGEPTRRGSGRVGFMGACLAVAIASSQSGVFAMQLVHGLAWLLAVSTGLDLSLAKGTRLAVRIAVFVTSTLLPLALLAFGVPLAELCVPVLLVGMGVLHYLDLDSRRRTLEGLLVSVASVALAISLAAVWLGSETTVFGAVVELLLASALWLGHLGWIDPRWSGFHRLAPPFVLASALVLALSTLLTRMGNGWPFGTAVVGLAVLWWATYRLLGWLFRRVVWRHVGTLPEVARALRRGLPVGGSIEEITSSVLRVCARAFGDSASQLEIYTFRPALCARLAASQQAVLRSVEVPAPIQVAVLSDPRSEPVDLLALQRRVVREPALRELALTMEQRGIGCIVPCAHEDDVEAVLLLPLGSRDEPLTSTDLDSLRRMAMLIGAACSVALEGRRAQSHISELASLHREAQDRIVLLENELALLRGQCDFLGKGQAEDETLHVAYSASMRSVQTRAIEIAGLQEPVWLEAGAGAPVLPIARFIHERGPRWEAPFIVADCAAVPTEAQLSLLLGSVAETRMGWLQSAAGGTLLLRDLPALDTETQQVLARVMEQGAAHCVDGEEAYPVTARIIATSRQSLPELARRDALDASLCERFAGHRLSIPALRERRQDLSSLVLLILDRACRVLGREPVGICRDAMASLLAHDWPGDVAELRFVVETAVARARGTTVLRSDLPALGAAETRARDDSLDGTYVEVEQRLLQRALQRAGGNKSEAARMLGLKRTTFLDKLRRHGLEPETLGRTALG